jgi:O-antigen/teichoic acid export membrane protein
MGHQRDFLKDAAVYGLGNGIKKFIGFFLLPFYTRALTPDDYGLLSTLSTFTMLISAFLNFGLDSASGYYFFQAKDQDEKGKVLFTHFILRLVGIIPPLILSFFSAPISRMFFKTEDYVWLVFISIMLVPVNLLMSEQSHIYRYFRKPWSYNITTIIKSFVNIGVGISLVVILKWGVIGAQLASIISSLAVVVGSYVLFTRNIYTCTFSFTWARKMLKFGFPLIWAGLSAWVFTSIDRFFLLHYRNLTEIGYYSIGHTLSQPVLLINMAVQMSFGVLFFKIYNEEKDEEKHKSKKMAIETFNLYLWGAVLLSSFLSIFGVDLVNYIATKDYSPGAIAIPFLTFSAIAGQAYQLMGPGITLAEKNWHYTWITAVTAIINIILNFIFIPRLGFTGAALSTLLSFLAYWWIKQWISHRLFRIEYPYFKIILFYFAGLAVSLSVPFLEFYRHHSIPLLMKCLLLVLLIFLSLIMKLFSFKSITLHKKA